MKINIKNKNSFKFSINNSIGIIKITYNSPDETNKHINIVKINEITNLFLHNNEIYIITETEKFIYEFNDFADARSIFKITSNEYINYYSLEINGKGFFESKLKIKPE